jgi:hypothetical protein
MPPPVNYLDPQNRPKKSLGTHAKPSKDKSHVEHEHAEYINKGKKKIHVGGQQKSGPEPEEPKKEKKQKIHKGGQQKKDM